ncbi:beta/gamma crystallin domain-containing protein [Saccharopolyspora sp. NPDC002578]
MITKTKKTARGAAAAIIAAAAFTMVGPVGTAFAINQVACAPGENFLKIWSHASNGPEKVTCYANGGKMDFGGRWISKVSTGNNTFVYYDDNGDVLKIDKWNNVKFNNEPKVNAIEIR